MRYQSVDYAVGWFILIALAIALLGLLQIGRVQRWFSPRQQLTVTLPEEGSLGLRAGSEVVMLGTRAGSVRSVDIREIGNMTATVEIRRDFARFVTTDADVVIKRTYGIVGDAFLEIRPGEAQPIAFTNAARLSARAEADPQEQLTNVLSDVRDTVIPTLQTLREAVESASNLIASLNDPEGDFRTALSRIQTLTTRLVEGNGIAARLVGDPELATDVTTTLAQLRRVAQGLRPIPEQLESVLDDASAVGGNLREITGDAPRLTNQVLALIRDLRETLERVRPAIDEIQQIARSADESLRLGPNVLLQLEKTLYELERTMVAIRGSWLLGRPAGREREPEPRLEPAEVMP